MESINSVLLELNNELIQPTTQRKSFGLTRWICQEHGTLSFGGKSENRCGLYVKLKYFGPNVRFT
jgi:hypothetical protein